MKLKIKLLLALLVLSSLGALVSGLVSETTIDGGEVTTGTVNATIVNVEEISGHKVTGNIDLDGHRITNLEDPVNPQDVATKNYVDSVFNEGDTVIIISRGN